MYSTCSICGGKDAYGKDENRPESKKKVTEYPWVDEPAEIDHMTVLVIGCNSHGEALRASIHAKGLPMVVVGMTENEVLNFDNHLGKINDMVRFDLEHIEAIKAKAKKVKRRRFKSYFGATYENH